MSHHSRREAASLQRVLLVRTDRLGDVLLTLPACAALRRAFPGVTVAMMVRRYVGAVVAGNRLVDEVVWYDDLFGQPRPMSALVSELRSLHFDAAVAARPTLRVAWMLARAGIRERVGTGYRLYAPLFTRRLFEHRKTAERHELEYNLQLLTALGVPTDAEALKPEFGVSPSASSRTAIDRILASLGVPPEADLVVLHPGTGGSAREWPPERFRDLGLNLSGMKNVAVVVTGTPSEERTLRRVLHGARPPLLSLAGTLDLEHLAALMARAALLVANSTGPLHLAVAVGTRVIGLYPPVTAMSARRWGPYDRQSVVIQGEGPSDCARCGKGVPCACMLGISVERVSEEVMRLLEEIRQQRKDFVA